MHLRYSSAPLVIIIIIIITLQTLPCVWQTLRVLTHWLVHNCSICLSDSILRNGWVCACASIEGLREFIGCQVGVFMSYMMSCVFNNRMQHIL